MRRVSRVPMEARMDNRVKINIFQFDWFTKFRNVWGFTRAWGLLYKIAIIHESYLASFFQEPLLLSMDLVVHFITDLPHTDQRLVLSYFKEVETLLVGA